jgi:hypothetical protein
MACRPDALMQFAMKPADNLDPIMGVARIVWMRVKDSFYECGAHFVWVRWKGMDAQTAIADYVYDNMAKRPS